MKIIKNYINGQIVSYSKKTIPVFDPSKGEIQSEVIMSDTQDFNNAIKASKKA